MHHLLDIGGAGSVANSRPLQRDWRDLEVASRYAALSPMVGEDAFGRLRSGIDDPVAALI